MLHGLPDYRSGYCGDDRANPNIVAELITAAWGSHRGSQMAIKKIREASPLWVWLAVVLLVVGAVAYTAAASIVEYFLAAAS